MHEPENPATDDLGLHLRPGGPHYRAYVGWPGDYDLVAAMTFNLMTVLGLRQHHHLLDIGCGSLRIGRLFIPYLNCGKYTGFEPDRWLVEEGVRRETGEDLLRIKRPQFIYSDSPAALPEGDVYDFAVAQSIFSHTGGDLLEQWLEAISRRLTPRGLLAATFLIGEADREDRGWVYPNCVRFTVEGMARRAAAAGLRLRLLDWVHPQQTWAAFTRPGCDLGWIDRHGLTWNGSLEAGVWVASDVTR